MADQTSSRAIKDFLGEAEEILEKLNLDLVTLGDGIESGEGSPDLLNSIFRGAHSFKGLSGMFGFDDISELSHHMENLLDSLRLGKVPLSAALIETLFEVLEVLTRLVHGKGESEDFTFDVTPQIDQINRHLKGDGSDRDRLLASYRIDPDILKVLTEYEEHRLLDNIKKGRNLLRVKANLSLATFDQELAAITELLKKEGEVISTLPSAGDIPDHIGFQLLVGTTISPAQLAAQLQDDNIVVDSLAASAHAASTGRPGTTASAVATAVSAPAVSGEVSASAAEPARIEASEEAAASLRSISRTVRVDIDKLDALMNIVGELVLSKGAIVSLTERFKNEGQNELTMELQKATRVLERRLEDLQKGVMEVRMVPVAQLFDKMVRIVRRVSSERGKKVTLDIRGADTELDKLIVEDLSDPLMHIIRNSIDHGIEAVEERLAAGKSEKGTICLWASQKGNHVVLEVHDDGRGIDPERVRRKAVEQGLITKDAEISQEDVYNLIFRPGFSTSEAVTELSGRGVGMDVVKNNISALSGMIEIDSKVAIGTSISITLPITLAIIKALIVSVSGRTYAIPINSVLETLMVDAGTIHTIERREVIELRETTLPLLRIADAFGLGAETKAANQRLFVVVVGLAEKKMGVVVDELLGQQDVVIKSLGSTLAFVRGISGAADLGNQKTILVLDVGGLMGEVLRGESSFYV
ncbi:MAG: chemotaxis protein CheA [Desulfuromonadales bacterium GWD2_61_12]|nr:MAG: chemotaxis protein CheA [Desulfuromonadales bacterium GWC2_61_20]OGR33733.1 MAG: chemotaxis protein CheA [Desulfuromonadales bacterium GWD2_61_12]HBT82292.1 chemotaxis protein CheA [Desulfuromonas sp.]